MMQWKLIVYLSLGTLRCTCIDSFLFFFLVLNWVVQNESINQSVSQGVSAFRKRNQKDDLKKPEQRDDYFSLLVPLSLSM